MNYKIVNLLCTNCGNIVGTLCSNPQKWGTILSRNLSRSLRTRLFIQLIHKPYCTLPCFSLFQRLRENHQSASFVCFALFHGSLVIWCFIHLSSDIYNAWSAARSGSWLDSTVSQQRQSRPPKPIWKLSSVNYCFFTPLNPPKWGREKKDPFRQCKCQLLCCHGVIKFLG